MPGGKRPGAGRKPGIPNAFTADIKAGVLEAFQKLGGPEFLVQVGRDHPTAFLGLLAKAMPMQVTGPNNGPIEARHRLVIELVDGSPRSGS